MAKTKNNFLNAKPVSKMGGTSGGVRKPSKPYSKPPAKPKSDNAARLQSKSKTERLQDAAKTKPKSPAPKQVVKKPVTRTGPVKGPVPPKGSTAVSLPNSRRAGVNLPKAGARAERTATRVADLKKGGTKPTVSPTPKPSANLATRAGKGLLGGAILTAGVTKAAETLTKAANPKEWQRVSSELKARGYGSNSKSSSAKPQKQGPQQTSQMVADYKAKRDARHSELRSQMPAPKPSTRNTSSAAASSSPARSSGGSSRSASSSSAPKPASNAGLKNQDKNYRGNLFEKTFGYKSGQAPDQVKARQDKAANPSNFDTKSNLADELKVSKVDGSKYADKKPDMNKVKEYDRRKRKYYD